MRLPLALLVAACSGSEKDPDVVIDTEPAVDDTAVTDTADDDDTPDPPDRDTGLVVVQTNEGSATVDPEAGLIGYDAMAFRWRNKDGELTNPRCIYARDLIDWTNDPTRFGVADPLGDHHFQYDPFDPDEDYCVGCTFSFTITYKNERETHVFPWVADPPPPPEPEGDGPYLSCENLREWGGLPNPDATATGHFGYGYHPTLDGDGDPKTGALMIWDMFNGAWIPLTYEARLDRGRLTWLTRVQTTFLPY